MAKPKEEPPKGAPAWQSTFADLMNLLLCFFVLLFSMSSVDAEKYEQVVNSLNSSFSIFTAGGSAIGDGVMVGNGVSQLAELSKFFTSMGMSEQGKKDNKDVDTNSENAENDKSNGAQGENDSGIDAAKEELEMAQLAASERLEELIEEALKEAGLSEAVDLEFTTQYVSLTMNGALLFDSGSATIKQDALPVVSKLGKILERYATNTIEIEGHTDNVPIRNANFSSNDELSGARALSVFHYLVENTDLNPASIKHSGRGEYVPVADNSTPEGRAKNRRVELKIYNELSDAA